MNIPSIGTENSSGFSKSLLKYEAANILESDNEDLNESVNNDGNLRNLLDMVLPPYKFSDEKNNWIQRVSMEQSTRTEILQLFNNLELKLKECEARKSGICNIKLELYGQVFDELIRQITLVNPSRGLLLAEIRDEINMSLYNYQQLFESSIPFGLKCALEAETKANYLVSDRKKLVKKNEILRKELNDLNNKYRRMILRNEEIRIAEAKRNKMQIKFIQKSNSQLQEQLETITAPK